MKKTLVIDVRVGSDFTIDAVWAGLVNVLGHENVIDYPPADKHRAGIPQITGNVDKDYGAERCSLCYTGKKFPSFTIKEINDLMRSEEIERIFIDERLESYEVYLQTIARFMAIPVVVVAGHDRFWNKSLDVLKMWYKDNLEAMFLDNWISGYDNYKNTYLINYATNFDHLWNVEERKELLKNKKYDIFFMGYNSHPDRAMFVDHLIEKYGTKNNKIFVEKRPNTVECFVPKREYFKYMAQSKICINLRGAAACGKALRFYEIPYVGSFMLSQRFEGKQIRPFEEFEDCDYFSTIDEMDRKIDEYLKNDLIRECIAQNGRNWAKQFHTAEARVRYMYECLSGKDVRDR
jgi:hypothetical protein